MTIYKNTLSLTLKKCLEKTVYLSFFSCIALTSATYADDTEVFTANSFAASSRPNVLLLFDSSASMNQSVKYYDGYKQSLIIDDTSSDCKNDYIYIDDQNSKNLPGCTAANRIDPAKFYCANIANFLVNVGYANARVQQRLAGVWQNYTDGNEIAPFECLADQGRHGEGQVLAVAPVLSEDGSASQNKITVDLISTQGKARPFINLNNSPDGWQFTEDAAITSNPDATWGDTTFVTMYTGHFLNYAASSGATLVSESGIELAVKALSAVVEEFTDINLGIARYNQGGNKDAHILAPIVSLARADTRSDLMEYYVRPMATNGSLTGQQPMSAGVYESYLYFKGEAPTGAASPSLPASGAPSPSTAGNNIPPAIIGGKYNSPIKPGAGSCQGNYLLFLTAGGSSGEANATDFNMNNKMEGDLGGSNNGTQTTLEQQLGTCGDGNDSCLDDGTKFLYTNDIRPDIPNGLDEDGNPVIQNVVTYGVSINSYAADLDNAANVGGGEFLKAENPAAIEEALRNILNKIKGNNTSFVAPSISVNNFNRLQNLNDLYYSLFTPTENSVWNGNLKKYKLIDGVIEDAKGNSAINPINGSFNIDALSYWTDPSDPNLVNDGTTAIAGFDGDQTEFGGFASRRNVTGRKTFTNKTDQTSLPTSLDQLSLTDLSITSALMGVDTTLLTAAEKAAKRVELIQFGKGLIKNPANATGYIANEFIGDLLHTTPIALTYEEGTDATTNTLDQTLFFGTNNGTIHAANTTPSDYNGEIEVFSYIPYETLSNLNTYYSNPASGDKLYGIDGPVTTWIDEDDNDLIIASDGSEDAYVYATQRRGGRNIYALEVSDRTNPKLAWKIRGGVDSDFLELGQTWSSVQHATIKNSLDATAPLDVVFFAGGYDENQDAASSSPVDPASSAAAGMGRAIYMVDAKTGDLLWKANYATNYSETSNQLDLPDMTYSIPSDLRVIDVNADGYADRLYVGDLGGQVWRFDMTTPTNASNKFRITGGVIANMSKSTASDTSALDTSTLALNNKRFYNAPSVSLVSNNAYGTYIALSIGSGYRAHPLDETLNEKFYMLKDANVYAPQLDLSGDPLYDPNNIIYDNSTDLLDISNIVSPTFSQVSSRRGWSIDFVNSGEKVINPAITADNKIFFTTYIPEATNSSVVDCAPNAQLGKSRLYGVSLLSGGIINYEPVIDSSGNEIPPTVDNRYTELVSPGISPPPQLFIESVNAGSTNASTVANCASSTAVTLLIGTETVNPNVCTAPVRTYWQRVEE